MEDKANWDIEFAKMFKDRDNPIPVGNILGEVVSPLPNIKISILEGHGFLTGEHLYICERLLKDHVRDFVIEEIQGKTDSIYDGGQGASAHIHNITSLKGEIKYTADLLKQGDEVLLLPIASEQLFFIVDIVRKLG